MFLLDFEIRKTSKRPIERSSKCETHPGRKPGVAMRVTVFVILSSIILTVSPFSLDVSAQQDADALKALGEFNIGKRVQPQPANGTVMVTTIDPFDLLDPNFAAPKPGQIILLTPEQIARYSDPRMRARAYVKDIVPLIREAVRAKLSYDAGLRPMPFPMPRPTFPADMTDSGRASMNCELVYGFDNCESTVFGQTTAPYTPKCKRGYLSLPQICSPGPDAYKSWQEGVAEYSKRPVTDADVEAEIRLVATNPAAKTKLAPYMLGVAWTALLADKPTGAQSAFTSYFKQYVAYRNQKADQGILRQWCEYKEEIRRRGATSTNTSLSTLMQTNPFSRKGFHPKSAPIEIGFGGSSSLDSLLSPAIFLDTYRRLPLIRAKYDSDPQWKPTIAQGDPMDDFLTAAGFNGPAGLEIVSIMTSKMPNDWPVGMPMARELTKNINAEILKTAVSTGIRYGGRLGLLGLEKLIAGAVGRMIGSIGGPWAIVTFAIQILVDVIMDIVDTNSFEKNLIKNAFEANPNIDLMGLIRDSNPTVADSNKLGVLVYLMRMLITDPGDNMGFANSPYVTTDPFVMLKGARQNEVCTELPKYPSFYPWQK